MCLLNKKIKTKEALIVILNSLKLKYTIYKSKKKFQTKFFKIFPPLRLDTSFSPFNTKRAPLTFLTTSLSWLVLSNSNVSIISGNSTICWQTSLSKDSVHIARAAFACSSLWLPLSIVRKTGRAPASTICKQDKQRKM